MTSLPSYFTSCWFSAGRPLTIDPFADTPRRLAPDFPISRVPTEACDMTPSVAPPTDLPVNILAVDDEPANLLVLESILDDLGRIVKANSGEEALRRVLAEDFAVI